MALEEEDLLAYVVVQARAIVWLQLQESEMARGCFGSKVA